MTKLQKERAFPVCAVLLFCLAAAAALPAQTFKTLVTFNQANGEDIFSSLVQGTDGNLYGTTVYGGKPNFGTIFKLNPTGPETILYTFCLQSGCLDGSYPEWLTQASDGDFYGETYGGGAYNSGTIFKVTSSGQLSTLYSFCAQSGCPDGALPQSALVQASDGDFYGTTVIGGAQNQGTVFKITPGGVLTTLYSFCSKTNCTDGTQPNIGLTLGSDGNFYGTTALGGKMACPPYGCGTAFKITSSGTLTTLYSFCSLVNCADGSIPQGLLVQAKDGNFYGTTDNGGTNGLGTTFKMNSAGRLKTLHSFCTGTCPDGGIPYAGLIQGTDGNFYGTAAIGAKGYGTVYKMTPTGKVTTLHSFTNNDGFSPAASLLQASDGSLYGGTEEGGNLNCFAPYGCGTLFRISAP